MPDAAKDPPEEAIESNPPEVVPGTESVTLYGQRLKQASGIVDKFKDRLAEGERGRSVILGRLTPERAVSLVRLLNPSPRPGDAVRHASVQDLIDEGFKVVRAPVSLNPDHCEVVWAGEGDWGDDVADKFGRCFSEPIVFEQDPEVSGG